MSDLDLTELRRRANADIRNTIPAVNQYARTALTLIDRIETLEAELIAAGASLGRSHREKEDATMRAVRAEARLARVTDDSMAERLVEAFESADEVLWEQDARRVLAVIRAAADEQEEGR